MLTRTSESKVGVAGFVILGENGEVVLSAGIGQDRRVRVLLDDGEWLADAKRRRAKPILLNDRRVMACLTRVDGFDVVLLADGASDVVLRFFAEVDFAWDIVDLVLTDPYDAMVVVDADAKIAFISPVHERFYGLKEGEGHGKPVRDVISTSRLPHVVRSGVAEVGQILKIKGTERVVTRHPIRHGDKVVGAIGRIMFKGPEQVEQLARRVNDLEQEIARYKAESEEEKRGEKVLDAIIGQSVAIEAVRQQIRKVAPLDVPVLIQGDSGTGKELVARALHMLSSRRSGRLVTVNAAALPATLVESELFGYEPGSFTGADRKGRIGKFEQADGGTIFLDEIGDMPIEVQSKLLRVLQDRVVERVGGDRPKSVDFRLCSATNRDLDAYIEQDKFRLDLFYRISPVSIVLPTLEERREDIPLLLHHFAQELADKYGRPTPTVDLDVPDWLMGRAWPGNIRQLRHEIERAFVFAEDGRLRVADFSALASASSRSSRPANKAIAATAEPSGTLKDAVDILERDLIADAMARFKGNKKRVAAHLGVSRSYLYKKLEEAGENDTELNEMTV